MKRVETVSKGLKLGNPGFFGNTSRYDERFIVFTICDTMDFEWDEKRRLSNIDKHGFDFRRVDELFAGVHVVVPSSYAGEERRFLATGKINGRFATAVFTLRSTKRRIISLRTARDEERQAYGKLHG